MIICTSICSNYLPKAMTLAESVKRLNSQRRFFVCLVEKSVPDAAAQFKFFDRVILAKDLGFHQLPRLVWRHVGERDFCRDVPTAGP
jgi:hypothetical protein